MAFLRDPELFPLTEKEQKQYQIGSLRLKTNVPSNETVWQGTGLEKLTLRQRVQTLLAHTKSHRWWLVPYPIDGLKHFLAKGIEESSRPADKNWFALNLARILLLESKDLNTVKEVLSKMIKGYDGKPILDGEGQALYRRVDEVLAILHGTLKVTH